MARFGANGERVGIAVIEAGNFNLAHSAFADSTIKLIDFDDDNQSEYVDGRPNQYHANHVLALIAGNIKSSAIDSDLSMWLTVKRDNPQLRSCYESRLPFFHYYGGLAPQAMIYAYARKDEDKDVGLRHMHRIFLDIEQRNDIRLINLSFKLRVNPAMVSVLNRLADRGIIFVQAVGNDGLDKSLGKNSDKLSLQFIDGAKPADLSDRFWRRHIWVGALSSFRTDEHNVDFERWKDSDYFSDTTHP